MYIVGCALPVATFGRLSFPKNRLRFKDGYIRVGLSRDKQRILCTLVDKDDHLLSAPTQLEACLKSERLGTALQLFLSDFNKYQAGEAVGERDHILVSV